MPALTPRNGHIGSATCEHGSKFFNLPRRDDRIQAPSADKHRKMTEFPNQIGYKRHHRPKEDCCCKVMRVKEDQTRSDVCAVRVANRDQPLLAEVVSFRCRVDEACQFLCSKLEILDIKNSFGKTPKEARHTIFQNSATDTQERGSRPQFSSER